MTLETKVLLAGIALFVAYVAWKLLAGTFRRRRARGGEARARVREMVRSARASGNPTERAHAYREAARLLREARLRRGAIGYSLRALHADPAASDAAAIVDDLVSLHAERRSWHKLERTLWRLLALLPADGGPQSAYARAWKALADLYAGPLRRRRQAEAIRRIADRLASGDDGPKAVTR